ncbi:MAG: MFS transporter [Actinomycetota bacterium]
MGPAGEERITAAALLGVVGTLSVIMPAFLTGALAVQIRDDLGFGESDIGFAIGAFFVGSACGSAPLGRVAERLGPKTAIRLGLAATAITNLLIAATANRPVDFQAILIVAGLANALVQPAINLMLVRLVRPGRLGFVMALKQSGMPGAALLGGLAVPAVALTIGWRAAYVIAAGVAAAAGALTEAVAIRRATGSPLDEEGGSEPALENDGGPEPALGDAPSPAMESSRAAPPPTRPTPNLGIGMLTLMAAVGVLGGGAANVLVGYLVSGAVAAGVSPGSAGLLLTLAAGLGVTSRLIHGVLADRSAIDPLTRVVQLFLVGSLGAAGLAVDTGLFYLAASPVAFAAGWAWPGLFNLVVVNTNRSAPAAATGLTQTGVYIGSLVGPIGAGVLIERSGYRVTWLATAASLLGAGLLVGLVRAGLRETGATDKPSVTSDGNQPAQETR